MSGVDLKFFLTVAFSVALFAEGNSQSYIRDDGKTVTPWLYLFGGLFTPTVTTSATFNSDEFNTSVTSNLEDEFNLPSAPSLFSVKAIAGRRSQFIFSTYKMTREGDGFLTHDINIDGTIYHVGASVHSYFNAAHYSGTFRYAFYNTLYGAAGASFGVRWMNVDAGLSATWNDSTYSRNESVLVPAVMPGVFGSTYILPRFLGRASLEYFRVSVSGITGSVLDAQLSLEYYLLKNFGLGTGYSVLNYDVDIASGSDIFISDIKYHLNGFSFFVAGRF